MAGPLTGFRVLDVSERSVSAAVAGMVLADLGAEVVRVEPQGGGAIRALDGHQVWFRGQQSVAIGEAQIRDGSWRALRASADLILDVVQPATEKPLELYDTPDEPWQVRCVLTAMPATVAAAKAQRRWKAPPAYGELVEAQMGLLYSQDGCREGPIFLGWPHAAYGGMWLMLLSSLGALRQRERTGRGQVVTTSLLDGLAILSNARWMGGPNIGPPLLRRSTIGRMGNRRMIVGLFQCSDGQWVHPHTGPRGAFDRLMHFLGREDLIQETSGPAMTQQLDPQVADELWAFVDRTFKTRPAWEWVEELNKINVCALPALPPGEAFSLEHMQANGLVGVSPEGRRELGAFAKYSRTRLEVDYAVPAPGEHTAELLADAPRQAEQRRREWERRGKPQNGVVPPGESVGPMEGLTVLDFGAWLAGPFSPRLMADLGARVIKVEETTGDPYRGPLGMGFLTVQRGKEAIAVNLKSEAGQQVVRELAAGADIVHHNMRFMVAERLGIGQEELRRINPRLVYCHSSGYGNDGPWSLWPAFEPLHSALTGILHRTGGPGNPPAHYLTHQDYGCGLTSTVAVLAAMVERERSGQGQFVEVPQVGAGMLAMADVYADDGRVTQTFELDSAQRGHAPTNALYQTRDGWLLLSCYSDAEWQGVRRALGIEAGWESYSQARHQRVGSSTSGRAIEEALAGLTAAEAEERLNTEGAPCAVPTHADPNAHPERLLTDPMFRGLGVVMVEHHPEGGEVYEVAHTMRFEQHAKLHGRPAPVLGQDTVRVLKEMGKSEAEIEGLLGSGALAAAPAPR